MKRDLPIYIIIGGLFLWILYTIIIGINNRDKFYLITTDESFFTTKDILIDSNNCLIFVDSKSKRKVKVCGNYEIKNPKNYEFEN